MLSQEKEKKEITRVLADIDNFTPYPINKSATIKVIQNRIVEHELGEGKSSNR